jgi:aryl-alcohol dehydrogenase-like predicted oxidoreductase
VRRGDKFFSAGELRSGLEASLSSLKMDYIDIFHLHAVLADDYLRVKRELVPVLLRAKEEGKIRYLGITESPPNDSRHSLLEQVFEEECPFEVIMLAFHLMHQNARLSVFPATTRLVIGTLIMFAVRSIFSDTSYLASKLKELSEAGSLPRTYNEIAKFREVLIEKGGAESIIDAAYRYARHEPGANVVLLGTGNPDHLETNIKSILSVPLKGSALKILGRDFSHLIQLPPDEKNLSQES